MHVNFINEEKHKMFTQNVQKAPSWRIAYNIGCLFDYPTGMPIMGAKGETLINGGLHHLTGITGQANAVKTGNAIRQLLMPVARYPGSEGVAYDTEDTLQETRLHTVAEQSTPELCYTSEEIASNPDINDFSVKNIAFTDLSQYPDGEKFFTEFKEYGRTRSRNKADLKVTPFVGSDGKQIRVLPPSIALIDSLSMFQTGSVGALQEKGEIGTSARNIEALRDNMAKNQMMLELPKIAPTNGLFFIMTAHLGKVHQLDPMSPPAKTLSYLKAELKLKNVPEKFSFLVHNLWFLFSMKPLLNQKTKTPQFPRDSNDNNVGESDLQIITCMNLRGKSGPSGTPFDIVLSQTDGILESMTEFWHAKKHKFGFGGNDTNYYFELMPEVTLSRTTVRKKLDEDAKLRVACRITADLVQMKQYWHFLPDGLWCDAKTLYEDIKKAGYDWDRLLQTRGYWTFDQYDHPVPFLSTMDLLYMRKGTYKPYWY